MTDKIQVLNCHVLAITQEELLKNLKKGVLITTNLAHLIKLQRNREFYELYQRAEWMKPLAMGVANKSAQ